MIRKICISLSVCLVGGSLMTQALPQKGLISNARYSIFSDRVVQDSFVSKALDESTLQSNYRSTSNFYVSPNLDFKFCLNGGDNEMNYDVYHHANITPEGDKPVVLDLVFGKPSTLRNYGKTTQSLPPNTTVLFRVDMRQVLKSFAEKGYFEDAHGARIYKSNLEGIYIAGNTAPLDWQFTNLKGNGGRKLRDDDKDGIYEVKLTFNNRRQASQIREWHKSKDVSQYPTLSSSFPLLNTLYSMSLEEMRLNIENDSTFRTGKSWSGVWTRDVSYSIMLAMGMLEPGIAEKSLMRKVRNNRIIQDTGTGGAWPCSSDRVVWTLAAWEIYEYTGDKTWLKRAYEIASNSVTDDQKNIFDPEFGLMRGESSFLDWREQTYPKWMEPSDIYASMCLGTNAAYYQVLHVLGKMATELSVSNPWNQKAAALKTSINQNLWLNDQKYFAQYRYGRMFKSVSPKAEALGEAFTVLFDIADGERKKQVLENTPVLDFGIPCIYPQIANLSSYHNNAVWPFVEAFWTMANAHGKNAAGVEAGIASIMRQSALFLTNKENLVAADGDQVGTMMNSDRQLWSIGGQLAMVYKVLFGMNFQQHQLQFNPVVPESLKGEYTLRGIRYRKGLYNVTIKGFGTGIASFTVDGKAQAKFSIGEETKGEHQIAIVLNGQKNAGTFHRVENHTAAETPTARIENGALVWDAIPGAKTYKIRGNGKLLARQAGLTFKPAPASNVTEYQVASVDAKGYESFLSQPVLFGSQAKTILLDASSFNLPAKKDCEGTTGNGYVSLTKAKKEVLKFSYKAPAAGTYYIRFRYANGNGPGNGDNKCGVRTLWLNGQQSKTYVFPQRGSNEWSNWGYSNIEKMQLKAGTNEFSLQFESYNENMNIEVNDFILDQIVLLKVN